MCLLRIGEATQHHRATRGPMPEEGELLLLDEADSLWSWQRAAAARRWTSIAFSTHRDLSVEFRLWGFRVETHRVSAGSFQQIERIVSRRIELAKQRKGAPPRPSQQHLQQLHKRHGDDVRTIFDELYEHYQQLVRNHVQM